MQYIKAPRALADFLGLLDSRTTFADGNYLLWDRDILRLAGSGTIEELLPQVGSVILTAPEVRAEQNEECQPHPLPPVTLHLLLQFMQSHNYPLPEEEQPEPQQEQQPEEEQPQEEQPYQEQNPDPESESGQEQESDLERGAHEVSTSEESDAVPDQL